MIRSNAVVIYVSRNLALCLMQACMYIDKGTHSDLEIDELSFKINVARDLLEYGMLHSSAVDYHVSTKYAPSQIQAHI